MKKNPSHLPEEKQAELNDIVAYVTEKLPVDMIILFGSFARGDWTEDRYVENGTTYEYKSDYDLLFVISEEKKAFSGKFPKMLSDVIRKVNTQTAISPIIHGIDYLNKELTNGSYFFTDILNEGICLYDNKRFELAKPKKLKLKDRRAKAQLYFDKWFKSANMFFLDFESNLERGLQDSDFYKQAVFLLHQATERYYVTAILVYTDYKTKTHDIEILNSTACHLDPRFKTVFPRETEQEEQLFTLLKKAYIDSRYKLDYEIKKEELEYLAQRVELLRQLTEKISLERIKAFDDELERRVRQSEEMTSGE